MRAVNMMIGVGAKLVSLRMRRVIANAGVPEAWIINLIDRWIEVYRDPSPAGYTTLLKILPGKSIAP